MPISSFLRYAAAALAVIMLIAVLSLMGGCGGMGSGILDSLIPNIYISHLQGPSPIWFTSGLGNPAPLTIPVVAGTAINDLAALRYTGPADWLYLVSLNANALLILNTSGFTFQLVASVPVGPNPFGLAIDGNANFAYVTSTGANTVTVVDLLTNLAVATIALPAGSQPRGVTVTPNGAKVYVANAGSGTVSIIDAVSRTVTGSIPVGTQPNRMALSPNGGELYVANTGSHSVSVIDVLSDTVSTTITGATNTRAVAVGPTGVDLYIGQSATVNGPGSVALYDSATVLSTTVPTPTMANPSYLAAFGGPGMFASADQNAARVTVQAGGPGTQTSFVVGESPSALALVRDVNRAPPAAAQCRLIVTIVGNGTVSANPASSNGSYACGTVVTLTATPGTGSLFSQWSVDLTGSANPGTVTMNTAKNVTATFITPTPVTTTVQANNPFVIGLDVTVDGTSWAGHAQYSSAPGSSHTHATTSPQIVAGTHYTFQNWTPSPAPNVATALTQTVNPQTAVSNNPLVYPLNAAISINGSTLIEVFQNNTWTTYTSFPVNLTLTGPIAIWNPCVYPPRTACVAPPAGMAGWWGMDTAGAASAPDLSGSNNAGTIVGGAAQAGGKVQSYLASGAAYLEVPSSNSLNFGTGAFSADMWVRWSDPTKNQGDSWLLSKYAPGHGFDFALTRATESPGLAKLMLRMTDVGVSSFQTEWDTTIPAVPSDGLWHLVAFSYNPALPVDSRVTFWVDLVQVPNARFNVVATDTLKQDALYNVSNTSPLHVGTNAGATPSLSFNGGIDEVEVFNRVITFADLSEIMAASGLGKCKPGGTVLHTITTGPLGLQVLIDGLLSLTPTQVSWLPGTAHMLGARVPQISAGGDTLYGDPPVWSPAGPVIESAPARETTYTGTFTPTGYRLTTSMSTAGCASLSLNPAIPANGFYTPGQTVRVSATPTAGYSISSISGVGADGTVMMSRPMSVSVICQRQATVGASYVSRVGGSVMLALMNNGSVPAMNLRINNVASSTNGIVLSQGAAGPGFPMVLGNLDVNQRMTRTFMFMSNSPAVSVNGPFSLTIRTQADNMDEQTT
ncbi:MAG: hypothetical protein HYZ37_00320, partial [Candidatus Solibacter usitatus]|nr:hypothetical protein [Candidatus Solibacter usitatus]